jgi:hypothetical protein
MYIVKVLKRKDAASVVLAIWLAMGLMQLTSMPVFRLANKISGIGSSNYNNFGGYGGWRNEYLNPFVTFALQVILLEILIRLFVWAHPLFVRKKK